jgi:nitroreductase/NAD-dependent dihydropyrimidine dehydrogenase PreA subunit
MDENKEPKQAPSFEELKPMLRPTGIIRGEITVDLEKCTGCGLCVQNCPFSCLEMDETTETKHPKMRDEYICMSCSNCIIACPKEALSIGQCFEVKGGFFDTGFSPIKMPLEPKDADGNPAEWTVVERTILERRSVRNYKKTPVPDTFIRRVLEAGRFAPSGGNHQPWKFTVVTDPEFIAQLEGACQAVWAGMYPVFTNDDAVINMVGVVPTGVFDPRTQRGLRGIALKELPVFFNAPALIFMGGHVKLNDAPTAIGICGENMNLAACALGLGACWTNFGKAVNFIPEIKAKLGFDENWQVESVLALGYPKFKQAGLVARQYRPVAWFRPGSVEPQIEE